MIEQTELKSLLDFAVGLAREAGAITQKYFQRSFAVQRKADASLVTNADRETENFLRSTITAKFPDDAILGEEEGEQKGVSQRRWIIDPIDGTFSFVHGVPLYGVLIGLEVESECVLGVVNLPALNEIVYAGRALGCFWNGEPARVSSTASLNDALLLSPDFGSSARALQQKVGAQRNWGDCYGHMLVATGRAEIMLDPVVSAWDCAALLPIVEEAGGSFTDLRGDRTIYGGSAISTNGLLFDAAMKTLREAKC